MDGVELELELKKIENDHERIRLDQQRLKLDEERFNNEKRFRVWTILSIVIP